MRNQNGTFARKHRVWTPDHWDDGYIDSDGRFRVYRPDYPRCYSEGYALRAHVVWWLAFGKCHDHHKELHHWNHNRLNDKLNNLSELANADHQVIHKGNFVTIICKHCKKPFKENIWRARSRKIRFCSQKCYHAHPRSSKHKLAIARGLKRAYDYGNR